MYIARFDENIDIRGHFLFE